MRTILMNIGLERSKRLSDGAPISPAEALGAVACIFGNVQRWREFTSDTEPTLVVEVNVGGLASRLDRKNDDDIEAAERCIKRVANYLSQDAIAWHDGVDGHMTGELASEWGPFNGRYFLCMDGERFTDKNGGERREHWYAN